MTQEHYVTPLADSGDVLAGRPPTTQGHAPREEVEEVEEVRKGATMTLNYVFFGIAIVIWLGIVGALVINPDALRDLWQSFRATPLIVQGIGWLLLLPWMAAVWLWQISWPAWIRLALIAGVAWTNLLMFYPRTA